MSITQTTLKRKVDNVSSQDNVQCFMPQSIYVGRGLIEIEKGAPHFVASGVGAPASFYRQRGEGEFSFDCGCDKGAIFRTLFRS